MVLFLLIFLASKARKETGVGLERTKDTTALPL
jgi:hypothetical protein